MEPTSIGLAFLAGLVSILLPCVLPLLPVVLSTAVAEHRFGPVALAVGLALSFFALGMFVATIGFSLGLNSEVFRMAGAVLLPLVGTVLLVPLMQARLSLASAPFSNWAEDRFGRTERGLAGQFGVGLLLGAIWSPCVGPTLGAASVLAAQGRNLVQVSLTMLVFAIGTVLPLILIGFISREALIRWRGKLMTTGAMAKSILGLTLITMGILVLTGQDRTLAATLFDIAPEWMSNISGRF
jgi:cytochrome c-type biogenesis protein